MVCVQPSRRRSRKEHPLSRVERSKSCGEQCGHDKELFSVCAIIKSLHSQDVVLAGFQKADMVRQIKIKKGKIPVVLGRVGVVLRLLNGIHGGNFLTV